MAVLVNEGVAFAAGDQPTIHRKRCGTSDQQSGSNANQNRTLSRRIQGTWNHQHHCVVEVVVLRRLT
jgi:hypothetical protein